MARDSRETASKILSAAVDEFSTHGLAGARVERIAREAGANIRLVYAHYQSKEGLFEQALEFALTDLAEAVPIDTADLAEWAGRVFDYHRAYPAAFRLSLWRELERPDLGPESSELYAEKLAAIGASDHPRTAAPLDLLILLFGMAQAWWISPGALRDVEPSLDTEKKIARHRAFLVASASVLTNPLPPSAAEPPSAP